MFGWDIMPRIVSAGIFRPVRLEYRPAIRLNQAYLMTASVDLDRKTARLQLFYDFKTEDADLSRYEIEVSGHCGDSSFYASGRPWFTGGKLNFTAENVRFGGRRVMALLTSIKQQFPLRERNRAGLHPAKHRYSYCSPGTHRAHRCLLQRKIPL